jgi:hypothetical protein
MLRNHPRLLGEILLSATVACWAFYKNRQIADAPFWIESFVRRWAPRTTICVLAAASWPLLLRLIVLPWFPAPIPHIHDEFSHLLVADTLLHGRLANPPHPLAQFFESIYVLQFPNYASIYPIGQGLILAAGIGIAGSPWVGVLLSSALMCGAMAWMLRAWLPPPWAAIGAFVIATHYGLNWMDSYFGGSLCAFGGALLFGAVGRLRRSPTLTQGLVLGLGWSVTWLVRPFESVVLALLLGAVIIGWWFMARPENPKRWLVPVLAALLVIAAAGTLTAFHNTAATGSPTRLPYQLSQIEYGVPPPLLWQSPVPEPKGLLPEQKDMYWWQMGHYERSLWTRFTRMLEDISNPYLPVWFVPPLLLLLFRSTTQAKVFLGMAAIAIAITLVYPFFFSRYIAIYSCVFALLILNGLMAISKWSYQGLALGRFVVIFLLSGACLDTLRFIPLKKVVARQAEQVTNRERIRRQLTRLPGRHLVIVRYGSQHSFQDEWVYNSAEIDNSPIVWSRSRGAAEDAELLGYYRDRQVWTVDVGPPAQLATLTPYPPTYTASVQQESKNFLVSMGSP